MRSIALGRWHDVKDGNGPVTVMIVTGIALHTEGDYRMIVWHPENQPNELRATPVSVFNDTLPSSLPRFRKVD